MRDVHDELSDAAARGRSAGDGRGADRQPLPPDLLRRISRFRHRRRDDPRTPADARCSAAASVFVHDVELRARRPVSERPAAANLLPTIALLKQWLDVVEVDGGIDYRLRALEQAAAYYVTPPARGRRGGCAALSSGCAAGPDEDPRLVDRGARAVPSARRQRRLVRFRHAVRRAALAARLPRARAALRGVSCRTCRGSRPT